MTSDPDRLLACTSLDDGAELERELLRSIADVSPPDGAREAAWHGLSAQIAAASVLAAAAGAASYAPAAGQALPAAAGGAASLAPQAGASLFQAIGAKVAIGAALAAGTAAAVGGVWPAAERESAAPPASAASAAPRVERGAVSPATGPDRPEAATPLAGSPSSSAARSPSADNPRPARPRLDEALSLESALVTQARAELKRGDPRAALATLQRLKRESPRGVLRQEREVLTIQALAGAGQKDAAQARARAFIRAFPESPHAPLLRPLAGDP